MFWTTEKSAWSSRCACRDVITIRAEGNMGDCGNLRCVQEKRHFRKELASWYKKIPFTIGLELVAENIAGNASGHIKTLLLPFNDMETEEVEDFQPALDCVFCQGKPSLDCPEQENIPEMISCSEQLSSQLQKGAPEQRCSNPCNESLTDSASAALSAATPQVPVLEGLNSFYNQLAMTSLLYQQQQLQSAAVQAALTGSAPSSSQRQPMVSSVGAHPPAAEVALDLRAEPSQSSTNLLSLSTEPSNLKVPEIRYKKKDNSLKRSYTDRELNAAVEAIKSGTVGTRRAAQMYGVPRSTLRNKVFKSAEMSRQLPYNEEDLSGAAEALDQSCHSPTLKSNSDSEASSPSSKQASPQGKQSEEQTSDMSQYNSTPMKQLEELQAKQGITDQLNMMSQQSRLLGDLFNPMNFAATGYPFFMPQYSALSAMPGLDYMNPYASSMLMPYLPEMMKNLAQKQLELECLGHNSAQRQSASVRKAESSVSMKQPKKDDIKVPAYKPSTSHMSNDHDTASKVAKSMVKKESVDRLSEAFPTSDYLQNIISQSPSTSKRTSPLATSHSSRKKSLMEQPTSQTLSPHSISNGNSTGKKRPKRGQYRKYDSERLADAVKAVQRGEMSVHRAGTHYGVPHSTLEYKVKERHLLRKKKIAENGESKSHSSAAVGPKPSSTTNAVRSSSPESNQSASKISSVSPNLQAAESVHSAGEKDNNTRSFLDFSPSTYQMDAPASELLMKLHAKAHQRANEIMNSAKSRGTSENNDNLGNLV